MPDDLSTLLHRAVADGLFPGAVAAVLRGDDLELAAVGHTAFDGATPMTPDTVFRIASVTKPITAVAALQLVADGLLDLDEPVERLLPELAERRVLRDPHGPVEDTEPAHRPITVTDLLDFRWGFGVDLDLSDAPVLAAAAERGLVVGPPLPMTTLDPDTWLAQLAELPLLAQPGERWLYDTGSDVLGVLLARACGQSLPDALAQRMFTPLGMADTGFAVRPDQLDRWTTVYGDRFGAAPTTGIPPVYDPAVDSAWSTVAPERSRCCSPSVCSARPCSACWASSPPSRSARPRRPETSRSRPGPTRPGRTSSAPQAVRTDAAAPNARALLTTCAATAGHTEPDRS